MGETEHDTWTDYGVLALPKQLLAVNPVHPAVRAPRTPGELVDRGQQGLTFVGVVTPELAAVWLARADHPDLPAVVLDSDGACLAGAGPVRFLVAVGVAEPAVVQNVPEGEDRHLREMMAAAAQVAGHPFADADTPVVCIDRAGRVMAGGRALADLSASTGFVILTNMDAEH